VEQDTPQEGVSPTELASGEKTRAAQPTGVPGNRCPSVIPCHEPKSLGVPAVLQGAISGRQDLKTGGVQAVPVLDKRQRWRARFRCLLGGPDAVPSGCGRGLGRESWGSGLRQSQSVSKAESRKRASRVHGLATALGVSFVYPETKEMWQPQDVEWFPPFKGRENISWHGQASCEIPSSAQVMLTRRIVPPAVGGKTNSNAEDPDELETYYLEGAVAVLGFVLFGILLCCVIYLYRKRKR